MKVLQIIGGLGMGGAERLIVETVPLMVENGYKVDVLLLNGEETPLHKQLVSTNSCSVFSLGRSFYNPIYIFKIIPYILKYDIIHVHLFPAQYFVVLSKIFSFYKGKLIFTEHNTENNRLNNPKFKWIEKFIYKYYRKIICITPEVKNALKTKLNIEDSKLNIIYNGINISDIKRAVIFDRKLFNYSTDDKLLIMVAGFREQKDHDTVLHALSKLPNNYKLILVGDGERKGKIENLARVLELEDRIKFLGIRTDVYSLFKMSDIAIMSSHWEGFGLAAAEAMACGIPTIASNVDGLSQVIENGGLLFEKGNVSELVDKIILLENEEEYNNIKNKGLKKSDQYDINNMVRNIIKLYSDLI
ncbi:glycosyltransferase family 4 protein [Elizabethkingia ursingii]|uniref:glycosyltransferase family 4 protein n=1 Tax=Elizabethkingia ursingii TaxID=1756150 RepID=UPI002011D5F9|nr:glycosyltransferase family 4 protein [Elizabethkingia ursingii]MCL1669434.1 glycosyltransferase family 4 protein [Elizabethkingia ursingii]